MNVQVLSRGEPWRNNQKHASRRGCRRRPISVEALEARYVLSSSSLSPAVELVPGDANQDLSFDQQDIVQVLRAGKYLTGEPANWAEGDWNSAPGGYPGNPPQGDGVFNQLDIVAALLAGTYGNGSYAALAPGGILNDGQTSVMYDQATGELAVDAPADKKLTSINIDSAEGIFTGDSAANIFCAFRNDSDNNLFTALFGGSFGDISFGNVAQTGLSEEFVINDLTVVGSLFGGGGLDEVDIVYCISSTLR